MALEFWLGSKKNFSWHEWWQSLFMHALDKLSYAFVYIGLTTPVVMLAYAHRVFDPHFSFWGMFLFSFVLTDFVYYVTHVYSHYFRLGWATHIVHHTPKYMNLSVGFRLGLTAPLSLIFLPYALECWLGVPPIWFASSYGLNFFYQFLTHNESMPSLKWVEYVFNTPATHRVHHGCNPEYRNKNFGGVFIFWDRIFGTFKTENSKIPIQYGLGRPTPEGFWAMTFMGWTEWLAEIKKSRRRNDIRHPDLL
jgi:sterol desaturase/sphingolipid hydroxylase (fatty acid hydroxylase superfamily)